MRRHRPIWRERRAFPSIRPVLDRLPVVLLLLGGLILLAIDFSGPFTAQSASATTRRFDASGLALPSFLDRIGRDDLSRSLSHLSQVAGAAVSWGGRSPSLDFRRENPETPRRGVDVGAFLRRDEIEARIARPRIPLPKGRITSRFGFRRMGNGFRHHDGIDIVLPHGAPIRAQAGGVVTFSGWQRGYGYTVIIDHGEGVETLYAHASALLVSPGRKVKKGEMIARIGNTGRSHGAHLHFEIRRNGTPVDPEEEHLAT